MYSGSETVPRGCEIRTDKLPLFPIRSCALSVSVMDLGKGLELMCVTGDTAATPVFSRNPFRIDWSESNSLQYETHTTTGTLIKTYETFSVRSLIKVRGFQ